MVDRTTTVSTDAVLSDDLVRELRRAFFNGDVDRADRIVREANLYLAGSTNPEQGVKSGNLLEELTSGIDAMVRGDHQVGLNQLREVIAVEVLPRPLQWTALIWMAWAAKTTGNLHLAEAAARQARDLIWGQEPDPFALGHTLALLGELEGLSGKTEEARDHLEEAEILFEQQQDQRGCAQALLAQARLLHREGQDEQATARAERAWDMDPSWTEPSIFLMHRAIAGEDIGAAEAFLARAERQLPRHPDLERERLLLDLVRFGNVPRWVAAHFLHLREALPGQDVINELENLMLYSPGFLQLREELAWKLLKLGRRDEAHTQFEQLSRRLIPATMRQSVQLGLGLLASLSHRHREPGARLRAVVSSVSGVDGPDKEEGQTVRDLEVPDGATRDMRPFGVPEPTAEPGSMVADPPLWEGTLPIGSRSMLSGEIGSKGLDDVLVELARDARSGTLIVSGAGGVGALSFRTGRIVAAASPQCPNIGRLLFERGVISLDDLRRAGEVQQQETPNRLLGGILVREGLVTPEQLSEVLREQMTGAVRELLSWSAGKYEFSPEMILSKESQEMEVELTISGLFEHIDRSR